MLLPPKRLLFVLTGEAFRKSKSVTLTKAPDCNITNFEIEAQNIVFASHKKLFKHLKDKFNVEVDVQIITYKYSKVYTKILHDTYKPKYTLYVENRFDSGLGPNGSKAFAFYQINFNEEYDYVFQTRFDLAFKDHFFTLFKLSDERIIFPGPNSVHKKWTEHDLKVGYREGDLLVLDYYIIIPKKYFDLCSFCINKKVIIQHHALIHLQRLGDTLGYKCEWDYIDYINWRAAYVTYWNPTVYFPYTNYGHHIDYPKSKRLLDSKKDVLCELPYTQQEIDKDLIFPSN